MDFDEQDFEAAIAFVRGTIEKTHRERWQRHGGTRTRTTFGHAFRMLTLYCSDQADWDLSEFDRESFRKWWHNEF